MSELDFLLDELTCGDDSRAEAAIPNILAHGDLALPGLLNLIRSDEVEVRWWAVRALAAFPDLRAEELSPLLIDPEPEVRAAAALGLCNHPAESSIPALISALADEDNLTSGLAGKALAAIGGAAVQPLIRMLESAPGSLRIQAIRTLAEIGDARAIPAMMKAVEEDSAVAQYWAQQGLDRLGLNMVYIKP